MVTLDVHDHVTLTPDEQELFDTLLGAAEHAGTNTVLRAAGGWVRDKLLGKDSPDIDIALDNMLGKDFADKVNSAPAAQPPTLTLPLTASQCMCLSPYMECAARPGSHMMQPQPAGAGRQAAAATTHGWACAQ